MKSTHLDMEDWTERYLDSIELMRLKVDGMDAVFYHDPDSPGRYTAEVPSEHAVVEGDSVAECIEELRTSVEFMRTVAEEERLRD